MYKKRSISNNCAILNWLAYVSCISHCKFPCVLIHWIASILQCVIQFCKCHHVQITETASILHMQWSWRVSESSDACKCTFLLTTPVTTFFYINRLCMQWCSNKLHAPCMHIYAVADTAACEGLPHNVLHSSSLDCLHGTHPSSTKQVELVQSWRRCNSVIIVSPSSSVHSSVVD